MHLGKQTLRVCTLPHVWAFKNITLRDSCHLFSGIFENAKVFRMVKVYELQMIASFKLVSQTNSLYSGIGYIQVGQEDTLEFSINNILDHSLYWAHGSTYYACTLTMFKYLKYPVYINFNNRNDNQQTHELKELGPPRSLHDQ